MRLLLAISICCALLMACGPPTPGDKCKNDLETTCYGRFSALECREGIWTKLPCFGGYGCFPVSGGAFCDITGDRPGDLCPRNLSGRAFCDQSFTQILQCQDGVLVSVPCNNCNDTSAQIFCR